MARRPLSLLSLFAVCALSLAAAGNGCTAEDSASVEQSRVYTGYWLFYDENANVTNARAQFRFGHALGTTLELKAPATVSFNGTPLPFNSVLQWHEAQFTGQPDGGAYVYVDTAGARHSNTAVITNHVDFPANFPTALDRKKGFTLTWVGPALQKGEDLELVVFNSTAPTDFIRLDQFDTGATSITVPADQLARVGGTSVGVSLRRHAFVDSLDAPDAGGRLQLTWEPKRRTATLE